MKIGRQLKPGYNVQAAVDAEHASSWRTKLPPMLQCSTLPLRDGLFLHRDNNPVPSTLARRSLD